jgi:hypothetical protein
MNDIRAIGDRMEKDVGKVALSATNQVVVRIDEYNGIAGVTIRKYIESEKYTGFTKEGVRIPLEKWNEFKKLVDEADKEIKNVPK